MIELPVSIGEALDKLTILDIKIEKIQDDRKNDVKYEYNILLEKLKIYIEKYNFYYKILKKVNLDIWEMQDNFRYSDKINKINLCLKIIEDNDCRYRIKKKINNICNSLLKEQKGYNIKKAFVLTHVGLGDNITSIGMVRYLSTIYDEVLVVCKTNNKKNVELFYNDDLSIKIMDVDFDNKISPNCGFSKEEFNKITNNYDTYLCGVHNLENKKFDSNQIPYSFYKQLNIPFDKFWEYFHIPNNTFSKELFNNLKQIFNINYAFIHNKFSGGTAFSIDTIEKKLNLNKDNLIFLNPNVNCYDKNHKFYKIAEKYIGHNLIHYVDLIKNADYNILSDSSFFCLAINLEISNNNNYYISRNKRNYDNLYISENIFKGNNKKIFKCLNV